MILFYLRIIQIHFFISVENLMNDRQYLKWPKEYLNMSSASSLQKGRWWTMSNKKISPLILLQLQVHFWHCLQAMAPFRNLKNLVHFENFTLSKIRYCTPTNLLTWSHVNCLCPFRHRPINKDILVPRPMNACLVDKPSISNGIFESQFLSYS